MRNAIFAGLLLATSLVAHAFDTCPALDEDFSPNAWRYEWRIDLDPAFITSLLSEQSADGGTHFSDYLNIEQISSTLDLHINMSFGGVGEYIYYDLEIPAATGVVESGYIRSLNLTGPFFGMQNFPKPASPSASKYLSGMSSKMGQQLVLINPADGLFDKMREAMSESKPGNDSFLSEDTLEPVQRFYCNKTQMVISFTNADLTATSVNDIADLLTLNEGLSPLVEAAEKAGITVADVRTQWVRRAYFPATFKGIPSGMVVLEVSYPSWEDAVAGTDATAAEMMIGATAPIHTNVYPVELSGPKQLLEYAMEVKRVVNEIAPILLQKESSEESSDD